MSRPHRGIALLGAVAAGALGGLLAALGDFALGQAGARQFLPDGAGRLLGFLAALYAGAGAVVGLVVGGVSGLLGRTTDLGVLVRVAFDPAAAAARRESGASCGGEGRPWWAYGIGVAIGLGPFGAAVYALGRVALQRFHSHLLIAVWVAALSAGLLVIATLLVFVLAALLSGIARFGRRATVGLTAPPAWMAGWWTLGLVAFTVVAAMLFGQLERVRHWPNDRRAFLAACWFPALAAVILPAAHAAGRLSWRFGRRRLGWRLALLDHPAGVLLVIGCIGGLAVAIALAQWWSIAKLLPGKPFAAAALALVGAAVVPLVGPRRQREGASLVRRLGAVVLLLALSAGLGLRLGKADRVRKAAMAHAGLAPLLIEGIQGATDFDRDGYSSVWGADCDDWSRDVHPGGFDWPDDGIDQNCNGHQATLGSPARPPFTSLPVGVPERPNVFLITIDAVRADHVGAYGYSRNVTPNLDQLAREGVLFKNGWAHSPSTRYSVPAILTGRYESTIAWGSPAMHWPPPVLPENRLLAEMFKERGYRTAAFLPYHYFERAWGVDQGFDDYDYSLSRLHGNPFGGDPARATGSSSREMSDLVIQYLERHGGEGSPLFMWIHYYDPHYLYEAHPEVESFGSRDVDLYDGELAFTDLHVGRLLGEMKARGLWDRSIVVATADHGESLGEHGIWQHGYHVYAQQNKVPFIMRAPGIAPRVVEEPVGHVDLFPSLLNLIGAPDESQLLGRSFVDLMLGQASPPRRVFGEVEYEGPVVRKAVSTRQWQLIYNVTPDHTWELYDLFADPQEAHDRSGGGAAREEEALRRELGAWMDEAALPADFAARVISNVSPKPLAFSVPIGGDLGGLLALDGIDVRTPIVRAGGEAEVVLYLRALAPIPPEWRLFTHWTAPDGRFLNADHQPVEGFVPLVRMRPGQYVRDRVRTKVPAYWPGGPLSIDVGLFRGRERAPATLRGASAGDHLVAGTVDVVHE